MLLAALLVLTTLLPRVDRPALAVLARASAPVIAPAAVAPFYRHVERAVSNWRGEAGAGLRPVSLAVVAQLSTEEPAFVARCAKLNNYWCIKSARWPGEVGADAEGHTGFATAADGADAAASLLRRYYRDYGRRDALAIVRRWAPAACRLPGTLPFAAANVSGSARRGFGGTLRARYLARHLPGGAIRRGVGQAALRIQPWSALARMRSRPAPRLAARPLPLLKPVPDVAARLAESRGSAAKPVPFGAGDPAALLDRKVPSQDRLVAESAALPPIVGGSPFGELRAPAPLCGNEDARIVNYAAAIARSVGLRAGDDLALFSPDGHPLPNLAPVMLAMSAVELGTLRAGPDLVQAAIDRLTRTTATADAAK